jgi:hypothetical protein
MKNVLNPGNLIHSIKAQIQHPMLRGVPFTLTSAVLRDEHQPPAHCPVTEHPLLVLLRSSCEMGFLCLSSGFLAHLGEASA